MQTISHVSKYDVLNNLKRANMKSIDEMFKRRLDCEEVSNEQKSLVLLRCSQMFKKRLRGGVQTSKNEKVLT